MSNFLIKVCQVKQKNARRVHRPFTADPSACVGTSAEICNGCLPFTRSFRKIQFESKWNMTFLVVPAENVREQRNKGSPVFPDGIFQAEIRVLFFQAIFDTSQAFAVIFR